MLRNIWIGVSLCVGILGIIIGWMVIPLAVKSKIAENIALRPNTESWHRWENLPVPIQYRIFIFNVTNPKEILNGQMPSVAEVGPYIYNEKRIKTIKSVNEENSSVIYEQKLVFEFDVNASAPRTEDDVLRVVNAPAMLFGLVVNNLISIDSVIHLYNTALEKMWPTNDSNPLFINVKVKNYLFSGLPIFCNQRISLDNVDTKILCEAFKIIHPKATILDEFGKGIHSFAFFKYKNNTNDGLYEIDLGIHDVTKIGQILSWNNVTSLSVWKGESCNKILGTDTTVFRPYLEEDNIESLYIYHTDVCRQVYYLGVLSKDDVLKSVKLAYNGKTEFKGIKGRRYIPDKSFFASVLDDCDNHCFCPQSIKEITHYGGCLHSGVLELSSCQGAPVIASYPHFLKANPLYQNKVKGLEPDTDKHQMFLDLEPNTGYPLRAASRVQINLFLKKIPEVRLMENLPDILVPALWIEEKMELTDELIDVINSQLLNVLQIVYVVKWIMIVSGIVLSIGSLGYYFFRVSPWKFANPEKRQKTK